ncbi:hypothetical protein [Phenylobacterium montanum]|uniref:Uncharacterized protein n=1 Tax=Phenylobacterium montanum TaxID=2823693 RepID=A0A975IYC7_9CAUL|nr:hypothetical protein [Caulobacter sp. S6]QUD90316.1 hypothetical protein KCG34_10845 [Caulobacter sp. S6]
MAKTDPPSTLKRPPAKMIAGFHARQVGADTVRTFLQNGWSLAICCKACPRVVEWTPPRLQAIFAERLDLKIAALAPRLACTGEDGCGSREVAVFPHAYDGDWTWPPPAPQA